MLWVFFSAAFAVAPDAPPPKQPPLIISDLSDATITFTGGSSKVVRLEPVKTAAGTRIRFTADGVTVEATRLVIKRGRQVMTLLVGKDGLIDMRGEVVGPDVVGSDGLVAPPVKAP